MSSQESKQRQILPEAAAVPADCEHETRRLDNRAMLDCTCCSGNETSCTGNSCFQVVVAAASDVGSSDQDDETTVAAENAALCTPCIEWIRKHPAILSLCGGLVLGGGLVFLLSLLLDPRTPSPSPMPAAKQPFFPTPSPGPSPEPSPGLV